MGRITISTDVYVDEIYRELDDNAKEELIKWLKEDEYLEDDDILTEPVSVGEEMFRDSIKKILTSYSRLSLEQIDYIEKMAKFL